MRYTDWFYRKAMRFSTEIVWEQLGFQPFSVNDIVAKFDSTDPDVLEEIRIVILTETDYLSEILNHIRTDDVFYDIGAHVGVHASFAARKISSGKVLAFEPVPNNVQYLEKNLNLNSDESEIFALAITDNYGSSEFVQPKNNREHGGPLGAVVETHGDYSVDTAPLDDLVVDKNLPKPNVIKVDVEGAEPLVLRGMKNTLSCSSCRSLFLEVHLPTPHIDRPSIDHFDTSVIDIMSYLRDIGFTVKVINTRAWVLHIKAHKDG